MNTIRRLGLLPVLMLSGCGLSVNSGGPLNCFQDVFQKSAPVSVSDLQGNRTGYRDETIYLRFRASKPVFLSLIGTRVHFVSGSAFSSYLGQGGAPPEWWHPRDGNPTIFVTNSSTLRDPSFSQGKACASYDSVTQIAYVYSYAWD